MKKLKKELNEKQLRATPARLAVLSFLEKASKPVSIQELVDYLKKNKFEVDTVTLYRITESFLKKGILRRINLHGDKSLFELTSTGHHHHMMCSTCGKIEDISLTTEENILKEVQRQTSFQIQNHSLEFFGICKNCT